MRFDWYQATVPEHPIVLVDHLKDALQPGCRVLEGRGRHNYHQSFRIETEKGERLAEVLAGGPNGHPNAMASGAATDRFVEVVRETWPDHRVTRLDSAQDFQAEGAWEALENACRSVASSRKVKGRAIVPDDVSEGRTYYMGSPASDVRVRLYEKTAEARRHLPEDRWGEIPENWVRLETQVRPRKDWKLFASKLTPEQAWGFSQWGADVAKLAMALDVERITMQAGRETDDQRALRFLAIQYGPLLTRMLADLGSWECVGLTLGEEVRKRLKP